MQYDSANLPSQLAAFERELARAPKNIRELCEGPLSKARLYIQQKNCYGARAYLSGLEDELALAGASAELRRTFAELFGTIWAFG